MLDQRSPNAKEIGLFEDGKIPSLCQIQRFIGETGSFEPEANILLKSVGLPEIAGYLAFSYTLNLDPDHFPEHDLGKLLLAALHSTFLNRDIKEIDIKRVEQELTLKRHNHLTEEEFAKVNDFLEFKVSPLIIERNYQSLAAAMIDCVINPYPAFGHRNKLLFSQYIRRTATLGEMHYNYQRLRRDILPLTMGGERRKEGSDPSLKGIIEELRSNWRIEHPTKFEQLLNAFQARDFQPMAAEEIAQLLFSDSADPERAVQMTISKLNSKLEKYHLKIERFSSYELRDRGEGQS